MKFITIGEQNVVVNHIEFFEKLNVNVVIKTVSGNTYTFEFENENGANQLIGAIYQLMTSDEDNIAVNVAP
ncbi:hypothetical protein [Vibrio parahaemolyticus]|uniref:hypothetical protein n=1 Tax=Vibrio parahaemolyticus TaxID=670 RepID=UPI003005E466